jgi:hypothetical protein
MHRWVEFVAQSCVSMYYNLWNIRKATSHYFSGCSLDQGTFRKQNGGQALNVPQAIVHWKPVLRHEFWQPLVDNYICQIHVPRRCAQTPYMRNHPKHTNKDRDATEQWAIKLIVYSNKDFDFAQVLDHCVPYIKVRQAFLYHHEGCSYVCGTESTIKKHKHPSNKAEYCRHHIVHQIFGQRDPKFTLIRGGVLPAVWVAPCQKHQHSLGRVRLPPPRHTTHSTPWTQT